MNDKKENYAEEIVEAEQFLVKRAQRDLKPDDKRLEKLSPFFDDNGILRVLGRIQRSDIFDYDRKHPMILSHESKIAELILDDIHYKLFHPGHIRVMAESRKRFWIIGCRKLSKRICYRCVTCRKWRQESCQQLMSNLPESRLVVHGSPFEHTSIDYFGPILFKYGRRARKKGYGVIFTCLTTRSIAIEFATDITTDKFLMAFRRFISVYGLPVMARSDNGSNFIGAAREIKELIIKWKEENEDSKSLHEFCAQNTITWKFNTPLAPHHNGAVESMVKSVKSALNKIVKERVLSDEEYRTLFTEIAACINSRPLWPISDSEIDQPYITCQDLIRPSNLNHDPEFLNDECNPLKRSIFAKTS